MEGRRSGTEVDVGANTRSPVGTELGRHAKERIRLLLAFDGSSYHATNEPCEVQDVPMVHKC